MLDCLTVIGYEYEFILNFQKLSAKASMTEVLSTSACEVHPIIHIVVICDPTVKMVIHTASMRWAIIYIGYRKIKEKVS